MSESLENIVLFRGQIFLNHSVGSLFHFEVVLKDSPDCPNAALLFAFVHWPLTVDLVHLSICYIYFQWWSCHIVNSISFKKILFFF